MDFRSQQEKQNAARQRQVEQNDYRQAFAKSQEENAQLHAKLEQVSASHAERLCCTNRLKGFTV